VLLLSGHAPSSLYGGQQAWGLLLLLLRRLVLWSKQACSWASCRHAWGLQQHHLRQHSWTGMCLDHHHNQARQHQQLLLLLLLHPTHPLPHLPLYHSVRQQQRQQLCLLLLLVLCVLPGLLPVLLPCS
jgi:hypothetical protein